MSVKMGTLEKGSGFGRSTLSSSWHPTGTALGQPASAPPLSRGSTWPGRAPPAARPRAEEQAALQQDQVQQDKIWRESVEAEWRGRKIW